MTRIERGSRVPTLDTLERLGAALGVSLPELFQSGAAPSAPKVPAPIGRIVLLLEREPAEVQRGAEDVVRAALKMVPGPRSAASKRSRRG